MERAAARGASDAVDAGYTILILSDRGVDREARADPEPARDGRRAPSPRARGHAHALRARRRVGRRARGAPLRAAPRLRRRRGQPVPRVRDARRHDPRSGMLAGHRRTSKAVKNYIKALNKGILKVMSKMGISTLQSYCGAQIFEAVGLEQAFVDRYFTWTAVAHRRRRHRRRSPRKSRRRHEQAFPRAAGRRSPSSTAGGEYQWRRDGEYHLFNPETVFKLQHATRSGQYAIFKEYTRLVDDQSAAPGDAARPARVQGRPRRRSRSTRSSRSRRSSSASRPARCRTARSARRRTRRSRSR